MATYGCKCGWRGEDPDHHTCVPFLVERMERLEKLFVALAGKVWPEMAGEAVDLLSRHQEEP